MTPGIGAVLWGAPTARLTVAPGTSANVWVAFYSTGPAAGITTSPGAGIGLAVSTR